MADNSTFITGTADGAFTNAYNGLPPWATEATSLRIEKILTKSLGYQAKTFAQLLKSATAAGQALDPAKLKDINKELQNFTAGIRKSNKGLREDDEGRKKKKKLDDKDYDDLKSRVAIGTIALKLGQEIGQSMLANISTYDQLTRAGVNVMGGFDGVSDGFESLRQMSQITGVRFTELSKSMIPYSTAINSISAKTYADTIKASTKNLREFGFTSTETAELLAQYAEAQRGFSSTNGRTQEELSAGVEKFGEQMTKLSLTTGKARNKIIEEVIALSQSVEGNLLMTKTNKEAAESTLNFIASFKDKKVGQELLKMMTDTAKPLNSTFMSLAKVGMGGFGVKMQNMVKSLEGVTDPDEKRRIQAEFMEQNESELNMRQQQLQLLAQMGNQDAAATLDMINRHKQAAREYREMTPEQLARNKKTLEASANLNSAIERFKASFQIAAAPLIPVMNIISGTLEKFGDIVSGAVTALNKLGEGTSSVVGTMLAIGAALYGFRKYLPFIGGGKAASVAGKGAGALGSAAGGAAGALGSGVGKGADGLLSGIASGLGKLSNPRLFIGAAVLTAASGAVWVAGKAFQQFLSLEWKTLAIAGAGIAGIIAAGAAAGAPVVSGLLLMGAASLAALGASIWVIGKSVQAVGSGFDVIGNGIQTISSALDGFTGLSKLKELVATINDINIVKAGALAVLGAFSPNSSAIPASSKQTQLNSPSTANAPESASSSKVNASVTPVGAGIEKAPKSADINSMMAFQNSVMEQLLATTKELTSVNKDILRYTRAKT